MLAPDFSLPDQNGVVHTLSDYRGKWVVVYFYPKDDTPGCTIEACSFRDNLDKLTESNVQVFGISKDSVKSHKKFVDKHSLNFSLLSNPEHDVIEKYGAWQPKKFMGKEFMGIQRNTYLINPVGEIVKVFEKVNPIRHVSEILDFIASQTV